MWEEYGLFMEQEKDEEKDKRGQDDFRKKKTNY